ncbi:MAG TPA: hypothetical protein VLG11_03180 [Candidatus Saccharimonadales bacterium]|nr:hypothetical protein [Candidatus Saccharimonadales bacterium]
MESYKSESYSDDESDSSSTPEAPSTSHVRHVALPASALHGFTHEAPKPAPEVPALESVFAAEQQRRQAEAARAERKEDDDESDEDDDTTVALPHAQPHATAEPTVESEHVTPIAAVAEALETFADEPESTAEDATAAQIPATPFQAAPQPSTPRHEASAPLPLPPIEHEPAAAPAELTPEAVDEQFKQMVELNLSDLQDLDLPLNGAESHGAQPPAAESADFPLPPLPDSAPSAAPTAAAESAPDWQTPSSPNVQPNTQQSDFEAWEAEMADQNLPLFPAEQQPASPQPTAESASATPLAESSLHSYGREAFQPFSRVLSAAELFTINNKLQYAESAARATGDAVTGLVAGWALARTFKNRRMIRNQERETKKQFAKQERANTELTEQNAQLRQRLDRAESTSAASMAQQAMPNRFRPAAGAPGETLGVKPPQAEKQPAPAPEQAEAAIRQETLETPPEHEVVRSGWHSIELDSKTGKAVENPTGFEYGEAFQRERRSEQLQDKTQDANTPQSMAAAPTGMSYMGTQPGMQPAPPLLSAPTPQQQLGAGKHSPTDLIKGARKQLASSVGTPWFWLALIFLVMVFFGAALL